MFLFAVEAYRGETRDVYAFTVGARMPDGHTEYTTASFPVCSFVPCPTACGAVR